MVTSKSHLKRSGPEKVNILETIMPRLFKVIRKMNIHFHLVRTQNFQKTNIFYPIPDTHTYAVKNVSFSENFAYLINR